MTRFTIILGFPYLAPASVALCFEHLWTFVTDTQGWRWTMSNGSIPDYYILLPMALALQLVAGIPGNLIIEKTTSHRIAIMCSALLSLLPALLFVTTGDTWEMLKGVLFVQLPIIAFFGGVSCVSLYFLHYKRIKVTGHADGNDGGKSSKWNE